MTFQDDFNRMFTDAYKRAVRDLPPLLDGPSITIHKSVGYVQLSTEQALDAGVITEAEAIERGWTPPPPPSRRDRLRWRWQAWRERTGRKIGGWLAGVDLSERDEEW